MNYLLPILNPKVLLCKQLFYICLLLYLKIIKHFYLVNCTFSVIITAWKFILLLNSRGYRMKFYQRIFLFSIIGLAITSCNSSSSSSSGSTPTFSNNNVLRVAEASQLKTPSAAYINFGSNSSSKLLASTNIDNNCFALVNVSDGKSYSMSQDSKQYYSTATLSFSVKNTCSSSKSMSGLNIDVLGLLINDKPAHINWIEQGQGNPYLTLGYISNSNNLGITLSTPACTGDYCDWSMMPGGSIRQFVVHADVNDLIKSFSVSSVVISGSSPAEPAKPGSLAVKIDSSALLPLCKSSGVCRIGVNVLSPSGNKLDEIYVDPYNYSVYTKTYTNLLIGKYSVSVDPSSYPTGESDKIGASYDPVNGIVSVNSNQTSSTTVTLNYIAVQAVGNLVINVGSVNEAVFSNIGLLSGIATNTSTNVNTSFNVGLNGKVSLNNLPSGNYVVRLEGMGDPVSGVYYSPWTSNVSISGGKTSNLSASFTKLTNGFHNTSFVVSGAPSGQVVSYAADYPRYKYVSSKLSNGTSNYVFLNSESALALTINQVSGYSLSYSPAVVTPVTNIVTVTYTGSSPAPSLGVLSTLNGNIVDSKGNVVKLKGINWFGFNNGDMLNGMWNDDALSGDFAATVQRLKALGFNAVRLPFSFPLINGSIQNSYKHQLTPASSAVIQGNVTNPSYTSAGKIFPLLSYNPAQKNSNELLPNDNVLNRFMWVIDFFAKNGFYVLIDDHREDATITTNQDKWVSDWKSLAQKINSSMSSSSSQMVMYDLLNEPDGFSLNWSTMGPAYLKAMDAINSVTSGKNLFFVEGSGQGGIGANWGDGFATDASVIQASGLSDPNSFFTQLAAKPYVNQVVLSPHIYPPSVTNATSNYSGSGLYNRLSTSFGTLTKTGYCISGNCHRYAVAVGEFGAKFEDGATRDLEFFQSFASYLNNANDAVDSKHINVDNWFYWSYNPNSGDTGGIVDDSWTNVEWKKLDYLSNGVLHGMSVINPNGVGLSPWYK